MVSFNNAEIVKASNTIRKNIKEGKGLPASVNLKSRENGKNVKLSQKQYAGIFEARNVFILKNGRVPNYVTLNSTANNPLVMDYQNNGYTCGPTSLSMASQMLYGYTSESAFAKACKTGSSGTSPNNLIAGAKNLGYKVSRINRNYSSVKSSLNKGYPVVAHIDTKLATCLNYVNNYGHYILIYAVTNDGYYKIADPTKGLKTCKPSVLDNAMLNRVINYYSVGIL